MRLRELRFPAVCLLVLIDASSSRAGMPAPLPTNWEEVLRLRETPYLRLQTISFFLAGLLVCAGAVQLLWNYLQRDFPRLPRLSYPKALAGVAECSGGPCRLIQ